MRILLKGLIAAAALTAAGAASAQPVRTLAVGRSAAWTPQRQPGGVTFRSGNLTLNLRRGPGSDADLVHSVLTVSMPGMAPVSVQGHETGPNFEQRVGVGRWARDGRLYVYFQTFSGGAHCCTSRAIVYPDGGQLHVADLGDTDGGGITNVPTDRDGDGVVDFFDVDNAFYYSFSSYAGSMAPPTIANIVDGRVVDVSTKPSFRSYFERFANDARRGCAETGNDDRNGACAGYVAASARLGRFDQAMADVAPLWDRNPALPWPTGCRVQQGEEGCPDAQQITYPDFPTALRAFLAENGYIPAH
jgi:hypothetical protein